MIFERFENIEEGRFTKPTSEVTGQTRLESASSGVMTFKVTGFSEAANESGSGREAELIKSVTKSKRINGNSAVKQLNAQNFIFIIGRSKSS